MDGGGAGLAEGLVEFMATMDAAVVLLLLLVRVLLVLPMLFGVGLITTGLTGWFT